MLVLKIFTMKIFVSIIAMTNGSEDLFVDQTAEGLNDRMDSGVQGVAVLMEDLRNAVEATLDVQFSDDRETKLLSDVLLKQLSTDTLLFYRKLLALRVCIVQN